MHAREKINETTDYICVQININNQNKELSIKKKNLLALASVQQYTPSKLNRAIPWPGVGTNAKHLPGQLSSSDKHTHSGVGASCDELASTLLLLMPNLDRFPGETSDIRERTFGEFIVD